MQDTPEHIKQLQLAIWLSKPIAKRVEQFIIDNDAMFKMWQQMQQQVALKKDADATIFSTNPAPKNQ